jgi:hypothetical protein
MRAQRRPPKRRLVIEARKAFDRARLRFLQFPPVLGSDHGIEPLRISQGSVRGNPSDSLTGLRHVNEPPRRSVSSHGELIDHPGGQVIREGAQAGLVFGNAQRFVP